MSLFEVTPEMPSGVVSKTSVASNAKKPTNALAEQATVWTDGACLGNPGPGGWAWARSKDSFASGHETNTTNQRMELLAVIEALAANQGPVEIRSDSTYVVNCFRDRWWANWRARGWKNSQGKPVANQDLWAQLISEVVDRRPGQVTFTWVKGHANDVMN